MEQLLNDFSPGLFAMQMVILLILLFLLAKFAWKPIISALNDREEGIQNALDAAEEAKNEMQNLQADNEKLLKEARAEREAMLKEAREMKNKMIEDAKEEAKAESSKLVAAAQASIESEKKAAIAELKSQVANLSNKDKQVKLVESMLGEATLN
jgi:F-type H+-transporting ATPase subunit b